MINPDDFYKDVELTEDEIAMAILEAKRKKWFHMEHAAYWENLESKKGKTKLEVYSGGKYSFRKPQSEQATTERQNLDRP